MPLPLPGVDWPPRDLHPALERMATWDAWWTGDTEALTTTASSGVAGPNVRPAQYAGGIVGAAARTFWGRPPTRGEPASKFHVPLGGDLCRAGADLLFSEPLTVDADRAATADALNEFLDDGATTRFLESAETAAGLGGVYLRVAHNADHFDDPWIDVIAPDAAYPEWIGGRLIAVTLWWIVGRDRDIVWRHLERHERGIITHGLYAGRSDNLGRLVPLEDSPATAGLATSVDALGRIATGYDEGLDIVYVPNMRPQRRWRKSATLAPFGRSDLDGVEGILDQLDETYSSWMRDLRLAKARIVVPDTFLDGGGGPGKATTFDPDREVYSTLPGVLDETGLTVVQFAIRVEEHERTAAALTGLAARTAGYNLQTLGESTAATAPITATETTARERRSFVTRDRKVALFRPELVTLFKAWLAIRHTVFGGPELDPTGLSVHFADSVSEDQLTLANTAAVLSTAKAASVETRVRLVNPDWDDTQVQAEVARILDEQNTTTVAVDPFRPPDLLDPDVADPSADPNATGDDPPADPPA